MARSESTASPAPLQPLLPRLTGTTVAIALPSAAITGPVTWPGTAPATLLKPLRSAAAFVLSAAVSPSGRSYTTTAGYTFGDTNWERSFRTSVDSAFGGSHDWASFFSAPVSFPDSGPATTTMTSQNTSTSHFVRRPAGLPTSPLVLLKHSHSRPVAASVREIRRRR